LTSFFNCAAVANSDASTAPEQAAALATEIHKLRTKPPVTAVMIARQPRPNLFAPDTSPSLPLEAEIFRSRPAVLHGTLAFSGRLDAVTPPAIQPGVFFSPRSELPRGRHALDRDALKEVQRERLMTAFAELVAERGLAAVTITDVVAHAAVSRATFYACFEDLHDCADATYERFISVVVARITDALDPAVPYFEFVASAVRGYLGALQADPVVARAMQLEMDAAGKSARVRRRRALQLIADVLKSRHDQFRQENPSVGPLPDEAHLGIVYAVRQLACDALEDSQDPDLPVLADPVIDWVTAFVLGAAAVETSAIA
jgi:AcrR family transcriptional regulator